VNKLKINLKEINMSDKKVPMLHEILAVEVDAQGVAKRILPETVHTFKEKAAHFNSSYRTLKLFENKGEETERAEQAEAQSVEMVTTVHEKLQYTLDQVTRFYDVVLQKEATNQVAKADLIVNNVVVAKDLPATFLLGMETKLKDLRAVYEAIPTLAPGIKWEADETKGKHVYRAATPEIRAKTTKAFRHQVLVAATDKHPAQIEKWEETVNIGAYTKETWSSCLTPTEKSTLLGRIDDLIQATKQARMRANATPVVPVSIGRALINFIHAEGF
jgi:hypothetical protein